MPFSAKTPDEQQKLQLSQTTTSPSPPNLFQTKARAGKKKKHNPPARCHLCRIKTHTPPSLLPLALARRTFHISRLQTYFTKRLGPTETNNSQNLDTCNCSELSILKAKKKTKFSVSILSNKIALFHFISRDSTQTSRHDIKFQFLILRFSLPFTHMQISSNSGAYTIKA